MPTGAYPISLHTFLTLSREARPPQATALSGSTVGVKRVLSSSDEDTGEEKKGESEGSAMEEASAPCTPQEETSRKKKDKVREKRRKRRDRRRAEAESRWAEEDVPDFPPHYGWSGPVGTRC